jgi:hypothetical protein
MNNNVLAYLVILVAALAGMVVYIRDANNVDRDRAIVQCERVNVLRAQSNVTDVAVWRNFAAATKRELTLAEKGEDVKVHRQSADDFVKNANDITVTPLTDCRRAIDQPGEFGAPAAAFPVGDARTGEERPMIAAIEAESKERLRNPTE